ncbi:DUF3857 domain-containing protein [Hugenholtzia roseola]|uniref:DUF3857 domain-containing protein n=1 Tax=Hugenholtzia roseola TaxID=1002 RepID=UPI000A321C4B|nr:DUF3857 domain-containing protein [Hugenholtzia roseola]
MKKIIRNLCLPFLFLLPFASFSLWGQNLGVQHLPQDWQSGYDAVVRLDEGEFEVLSAQSALARSRFICTIFNAEGEERFSERVEFYDNKFTFIKKIEGSLYDKNGKKIKELKKSDIIDESYRDGVTLHADTRLKRYRLAAATYPYTIVFEVEKEVKNLLHSRNWYFQSSPRYPVVKATYRLITPEDFPIRYREYSLQTGANIKTVEQKKYYTWEAKQIAAFEPEPFSPHSLLPQVRITFLKFEIEGYQADLSTWQNFGKWQTELLKGRNQLPESTIEKIKNLVQKETDEKEKIRLIYEYMQSRTRYVSIQLGIGGWQPFAAHFVDEKGYGDCKALTNYTQALLKAANIEAYYALIESGENPRKLEQDFPNNTFNHVILCVPLSTQKDTVWLECTSQQEAMGYLSDFTSNRQALLIKPEGGELVQTPSYGYEKNKQQRKLEVFLQADGSAKVNLENQYHCLSEENRAFYTQKPQAEQQAWLSRNWQFPTFEIIAAKMWRKKNDLPISYESGTIQVLHLASKTGNRLFFQPNFISKQEFTLPATETRSQQVKIESGKTETDSVLIHLPEGYQIENLPKDFSYENKMGKYAISFEKGENTILYKRKFMYYEGTFDPAHYTDLSELFRKAKQMDAAQIVLFKP